MDFQRLGNHLSRVFVHEITFPLLRGFVIVVSRTRLRRSLKLISKKATRTRPLLVRQEREKERVPIKERMRNQPHNCGRIMT